jgi:uncharacterized protein (DUF1778 family)
MACWPCDLGTAAAAWRRLRVRELSLAEALREAAEVLSSAAVLRWSPAEARLRRLLAVLRRPLAEAELR